MRTGLTPYVFLGNNLPFIITEVNYTNIYSYLSFTMAVNGKQKIIPQIHQIGGLGWDTGINGA